MDLVGDFCNPIGQPCRAHIEPVDHDYCVHLAVKDKASYHFSDDDDDDYQFNGAKLPFF